MRESLAALCRRFAGNNARIRTGFGWESAYLYPVCAAIFTDHRQDADLARMRECRALLRQQTGVFSNFRGTGRLAMVTQLAVDTAPAERLQRALAVYGLLKAHFVTNQYLPLVSMVVADAVSPARYGEVAARTRQIYLLMRRAHPILTEGSDSVFAALLALSPLSDEAVVRETEQCYAALKPAFFSGGAVQSLSHVLALGEGAAPEKCRRTLALFDAFKSRGRRYGTGCELASLGVLALLPESIDQLVEDTLAVDDFLARQRGYGLFGLGRRQRLMHAGMLVASDLIGGPDSVRQSAAISGAISLVAAQQAAMVAAITASVSASASAGS